MGNMEKCDNGHLYNPKKYDECPYCDESKLDKKEGGGGSKGAAEAGSDPGETLSYWEDEEGYNPVVGWIVCIEGATKGKDYKLYSEKNFIGRSEEMNITIQGDQKISRRNHAIISYNPKERNFVLIPGEGKGIIYANEDAVYSATEISDYDVIEMGESKFIFNSLCGQHFEWEKE